jgi:selenide,water dikinase
LGGNVHISIDYRALKFYMGAEGMYQRGQTTGSNKANRTMVARHKLLIERPLTSAQEELLYDPQTSGGLLLALPAEQASLLLNDLQSAGIGTASLIGQVTDAAVGLTVR